LSPLRTWEQSLYYGRDVEIDGKGINDPVHSPKWFEGGWLVEARDSNIALAIDLAVAKCPTNGLRRRV